MPRAAHAIKANGYYHVLNRGNVQRPAIREHEQRDEAGERERDAGPVGEAGEGP